jgi:hypothetical protein
VTAQTRFHGGVLRTLFVVSAFCVGALIAALSPLPTADAAKPNIVVDGCNQTSGGGEGHECNSSNDLLLRSQNPDGTCGDWICCPPNGDGTYNCDQGSSAGLSAALRNRLRRLRASQATTLANPDHMQRPVTATTTHGATRSPN